MAKKKVKKNKWNNFKIVYGFMLFTWLLILTDSVGIHDWARNLVEKETIKTAKVQETHRREINEITAMIRKQISNSDKRISDLQKTVIDVNLYTSKNIMNVLKELRAHKRTIHYGH